MATQAFPPTPQQAPPGGAPPNAVGQMANRANPAVGNIVQRVATSLQDLTMFSQQLRQVKPTVSTKIDQGIQMIVSGLKELATGQGGPTSPQGGVPAPPQQGAVPQPPSPAETPEAT